MKLHRHVVLLLAALTLMVGGPPSTSAGETPKDRNIDVRTARTMIENTSPKVIVLDVRTPAEFAEGHLAGAVNIDRNDSAFERSVLALSRKIPIVIYCASGRRSSQALDLLTKHGYTNVYNVVGGIAAWTSGGGAIVKDR